jgi:hypothetical protein
MPKDFNPIMADSNLEFYGTVFVDGEPRGSNSVTFRFSLAYILSDLGAERIESKNTKGYVHYEHYWGNRKYDFTDHNQFIAFREIVKKAYKEEEAFWKNLKEKKKKKKK